MQSQNNPVAFDEEHAKNYDDRFAKLAPFRDSLHLLMSAIFADLPADARILCVGAGTGLELVSLAQKHPGWHFTAVDPSGPMLEVCRRRAQELGIASRCDFHTGYLDSLPSTQPYDAATSILVSQFVLDRQLRTSFFRGIAERLKPNGILVSADLSSGDSPEAYEKLLEVWLRLMTQADLSADQVENLRTAYSRNVAVLPIQEVSDIIASGGFETPNLFLQTGLIHAWYAERSPHRTP